MRVEGLCVLIVPLGRPEGAMAKERGSDANMYRIGDRQRGGGGIAKQVRGLIGVPKARRVWVRMRSYIAISVIGEPSVETQSVSSTGLAQRPFIAASCGRCTLR